MGHGFHGRKGFTRIFLRKNRTRIFLGEEHGTRISRMRGIYTDFFEERSEHGGHGWGRIYADFFPGKKEQGKFSHEFHELYEGGRIYADSIEEEPERIKSRRH